MKSKAQARNTQGGFSLLELLGVVAIIGVLSAISVVGYKAVANGTKESLIAGRLREVAEAQMQFRVGKASHRYGTLQELRTTMTPAGMPLLSPQLVPADAKGNPVAYQGWIIREPDGAPSGDALRSAYSVVAVPAEETASETSYCIHQDGTLRMQDRGGTCTINSTPVDQPPPGRLPSKCPDGSAPPCFLSSPPTPIDIEEEGKGQIIRPRP